MSNLRPNGEDTGVGGLMRTTIIEKGPLRIGFVGIVEKEWFETFQDLDEETEFLDEKKTATELA